MSTPLYPVPALSTTIQRLLASTPYNTMAALLQDTEKCTRGRHVAAVNAVSKRALDQKTIDVAAQISAFVIAGALEHALSGGVPIELYLRYPGNIDVAIDAEIAKTAQRLEDRREYLQHRAHLIRQEQQIISAQVLAHILATTSEDAREACLRADLRTRRESARSGCHHARSAPCQCGQEHAD